MGVAGEKEGENLGEYLVENLGVKLAPRRLQRQLPLRRQGN